MAESDTSIRNTKMNPIDHLPLSLLRSDTVPPAPTFSDSTIDFLPHFSGYSWIAYAASSLLVISHFPSPLSPHQSRIGPIFRQSFQLSADPLSAVAWSPRSPSSGDLAAAADNCICLFRHDSTAAKGNSDFHSLFASIAEINSFNCLFRSYICIMFTFYL